MESNVPDDIHNVKNTDETPAAVNSSILDYYKKFGRKRDLEQYFSLSTADSEVRDVSGIFWRKMKSQDSSDSMERKSESSTELCRISIKCSIPDRCSSQEENSKTKSDSDSPPIINEDVEIRHTDDEFVNEDNQSQKSMDAPLDTSMNKPLSPTSSITSQRKLEWDSLADVGYANENDGKGSASSLSTLERLALKQQYSNNDTKDNNELGPPTAHSTPVDIDIKPKNKKGATRKTTKMFQKDVDIVEVNMPQSAEARTSQSINVNLTKHISFNMDKSGKLSVDNVKNDINITPNKDKMDQEAIPNSKTDKEIQTSLTKANEKCAISAHSKLDQTGHQKNTVLINLNTLKKRYRRKRGSIARRKLKSNKMKYDVSKENIPIQEKSTEQVSAAESFEYMPGHVYNQNQINFGSTRPPNNNNDNKSSLESSRAVTTDSSKSSKHSFTKDLEKSIDLLKVALQKHYNDSELKNKLVKEVVQRLLKSRYRDDDSTTDFLSGLSFSSKKLGLGSPKPSGHLTTSTSDSNNTELKPKLSKPKKSILRLDKFNANVLASTSQSAPNLPVASSSEKPLIPNPLKLMTSNTESDVSSGGQNSSDTVFIKTSSEELYQKYLEALRREEAYRKHLRDKELFLKQKRVSSDTVFKASQPDEKVNNRLKDLIKDLTRNNYDDGSGDASKLEGGSNSNLDIQRGDGIRKHRSHSVFTLSSGNSDDNRKSNLKKRLQNEMKHTKTNHPLDDKHCCCPHHFTASKVGVTDSSVQVNIRCNEHSIDKDRCQGHMLLPCNIHQHNREPFQNVAHVIPDDASGEIKYVCLCSQKPTATQEVPENMLIYKCSRLTNRVVQLEDSISKTSNTVGIQCMGNHQSSPRCDNIYQPSTSKLADDMMSPKIQSNRSSDKGDLERMSKSSQTNIPLTKEKSSESSSTPSSLVEQKICDALPKINKLQNMGNEATRCVQTEISINPRISDLSLTDVNILTDVECEKLMSDHHSQIVKCSSESDVQSTNLNKKQNIDHVIKSCSKSTQENSWDIDGTASKLSKEIQSNFELNNNKIDSLPKVDHLISDNFKIPIQGTNMTLMVRIDSKTDEMKTHGVVTDKVELSEKATCLPEECTKGVQSHATDIFTMIDKESYTIDKHKQSPKESSRNDGYKESPYQQCTIKPCIKTDIKSHTYPKINSKPFIRSNTGTEKFISTHTGQTDRIEKNNFVTQEDVIKVSLSTKNTNSDGCENSKASSEKSDSLNSNELKDSSSEARSRKSISDDPIMDIIKDITNRYTKKDVDKIKRKKCYKEIMNVLNYLLNTEDGTDIEERKLSDTSSTRDTDGEYSRNVRNKLSTKVNAVSEDMVKVQEEPLTVIKKDKHQCDCSKELKEQNVSKPSEKEKYVVKQPCAEDKAVQSSPRTSNRHNNYSESSEIQATTEFPSTSSESATCKVLSKIKRECEKYHQKRCKCHGKKFEASSSTSVTCEQCKRNHHCPCKSHRCHRMKSSADKIRKKCVAYNLIIQTSDSMASEETMVNNETKPLRNIIVKVPPKRKQYENAPFKEVYTKIEKTLPHSPRDDPKVLRSCSLPNESEMSSVDDYMKKNKMYTVKEYLEINRPDFVQKSSHRQESLKHIGEMRANQRAAQLQLLSAQLDRRPPLTSLSETELRRLAEDLGMEIRKKKIAPKFINEREMKKHSEKIYKSLPEVVQKKEEAKKDNIKKTNLLMANIFKRNLQKKTLRGSVNLSNYSTIIKI